MWENDRWETYKDKRDEFRWRRKASNGKIVGSACEGYTQKSACEASAQRHGKDGNPKGFGSKDKWDVYQDKRGQYRWRRKATNGEVTGASSESYASKADADANAKRNGM